MTMGPTGTGARVTRARSPRNTLIRTWAPRSGPAARIYVFPHAGAGALAVRGLAAAAPEWMEIVALRLPGRESRLRERPLTDLDEAVTTVADTVLATDDGTCPAFWFGACAGSVLAFETATRLAGAGRAAGIVVSSRSAPHIAVAGAPEDDEATVKELVALGGIRPELVASPEALKLLLPAVTADQRLVDGYRRPARAGTDLPILALHGVDDPLLGAGDMRAWGTHTTSTTRVARIPGGHFLLDDSPQALAAEMAEFTLSVTRSAHP
ncbi:thioesterase domain-containing protein [Streptomyces sp. NPDC046909]|uniref:thioesterase II family protein n=1 Tax=Streptomyces sp. NPDC046909 TaxID=3155617 RepID=UPI0033FAB878